MAATVTPITMTAAKNLLTPPAPHHTLQMFTPVSDRKHQTGTAIDWWNDEDQRLEWKRGASGQYHNLAAVVPQTA